MLWRTCKYVTLMIHSLVKLRDIKMLYRYRLAREPQMTSDVAAHGQQLGVV